MKCIYCQRNNAKVKEHFYPKCLGGKKAENLVPACRACNVIKNKFVFWSIESAREYISFRKSRSIQSYRKWLSNKIRQIPKERLFLLELAFQKINKDMKQ